MIQRHKRFLFFLAVIIGSSFLSACSGFQSTPFSSTVTDIRPASPVSVANEYPNLVPLPSESKMCLQRELEALRQTGAWETGLPFSTDSNFGKVIHYDFPVIMNKQVKMYIHFFQHDERDTFATWLGRSTRYLPMIRKDLKSAGLPLDLAYLAMIESGFNQRAYSSARASGLWQFLTGTARQYDLRVNRYVDERRNAEKSTQAAVAMLSDLHHRFNDWYLAVAAYNAGAGKISYGLRRYHVKTFWELARKHYLNYETIRYVPALMAAIIIAKDPEKYGFSNINYLKPLQYDTLSVGPGIGLDGLALITHSSKKKLQRLNPELIAGIIPWNRHRYEVKIPAGTKEIAERDLPRLRRIVSTEYRIHIVHRHESLAAICRKFGISRARLFKSNKLDHRQLIAGLHLKIPVTIVRYRLAPKTEAIAQNGKRKLILHRLRPGETVFQIARQFHLQPDMILSWNNIKDAKRLQIGQEIALYVPAKEQKAHLTANESSASKTAYASAKGQGNSRIALVSQKKSAPLQTSTRATFKYYRIESGDTLWRISQKFKTSPEQIKTWNNLKSNIIHPGDKLKVKKPNPVMAEGFEDTVL